MLCKAYNKDRDENLVHHLNERSDGSDSSLNKKITEQMRGVTVLTPR